MKKVVVVGSFVTDMVATMDRFPQAGETIIGNKIRVFLGGKGINQCVACRRLGIDTTMVGMLGNDGNGDNFRKLMNDEGIRNDCVFVTEEEPTAIAQVQIDGNSQNRICVIPSANYCFTKEDLEKAKDTILDADIVVTQLEMKLDVVEELLDLCYKNNKEIILNPAPAQILSDDVYKKVTYLTPNETEMEFLTGIDTSTEEGVYKAAESLIQKGVKNIIATLGKRGALIYNAKGKQIVSGYPVKAVDTVAAGDSFNGALARCFALGMSLEDSVKFANAVGALAVTKNGAIPSLPTLKEVNDFIAERTK